jgi:hypothetical protein
MRHSSGSQASQSWLPRYQLLVGDKGFLSQYMVDVHLRYHGIWRCGVICIVLAKVHVSFSF